MKTAFAYWDDRIAPVFDTAPRIHVVETEAGRIVGESEEVLPQGPPVHRALRLVELGIGALVCGAISRPQHGLVAAYGIEVVPFVAGDLREVVKAWIGGGLDRSAFAMPGCRGRRGRCLGGRQGMYQEVRDMNRKGRGMGGGGGQGQGGQGRGQGGQGAQGGRRPGRMGGPLAAGPAGYCVCSQCGQREPHQRGLPCAERRCSKCGAAMTRE